MTFILFLRDLIRSLKRIFSLRIFRLVKALFPSKYGYIIKGWGIFIIFVRYIRTFNAFAGMLLMFTVFDFAQVLTIYAVYDFFVTYFHMLKNMAEDVIRKIFYSSSPPKSSSILSRAPIHTAGVSANLDETFEQFRKKYIDTEKPKGWFSSEYLKYILGFFLLALFGFFIFSYWPEDTSSDSDSEIDPDDKGEGPSNKGKGRAVEPQNRESSSYLSRIGKFLPSLPIAWPSLPTFDLAQYIKDYLFSSTPKKPTLTDAEFNKGLVDLINGNQEMEAVFDADKEDITVTDARTRAPSPEAEDEADKARKAFLAKDVPTLSDKEETQIRAEYDIYFWPDEAAQQKALRAAKEAEAEAAALALEEAEAAVEAKASAEAKAAAEASTELEEADEDLEDEDEESEDEESEEDDDEEGEEGSEGPEGSDTETESVSSESTIKANKQINNN